MKNSGLLMTAVGLIVAGLLFMFVVPTGEPELECAEDTTRTSGFVDDESGCPISIESYDEYQDWESSPKPTRIIGLVLVVAGLGAGITAAVKKS